MYKILGTDGREYGPVPAETIRQWIAENRANGDTKVQPEGAMDWRPLATLPEFADALREKAAQAPPPALGTLGTAWPQETGASLLPPDVAERDYTLDIGECISRAWALVTGPRMGIVIGGVAVWILIQLGLAGLGQIPLLGLIFSLGSFVIGGPLIGGVYLLMLRCLRGQPAQVDNLFDGFRYNFIHLFLGQLVMMLLTFIAVIPSLLLIVPAVIMLIQETAQAVAVGMIIVGAILALVPLIYLSVSFAFTLPLIADKRLDFWPAMMLSRRVVGKHWWMTLLLFIVVAIFNFLGMLVCCVGWFFTAPLAFAAMAVAYETMFSARPALPVGQIAVLRG